MLQVCVSGFCKLWGISLTKHLHVSVGDYLTIPHTLYQLYFKSNTITILRMLIVCAMVALCPGLVFLLRSKISIVFCPVFQVLMQRVMKRRPLRKRLGPCGYHISNAGNLLFFIEDTSAMKDEF